MHCTVKNHISGIMLAVLFLICCRTFYPIHASGIEKSQKDSLLLRLSESDDLATQINSLQELYNITMQTPEGVYYLNRLLSLAERIDSINLYYWSLCSLGRYYANELRPDSLIYCVSVIDSITKVRKDTPDELFALHNYLCRYYLITEDYELAMNEAVREQMSAEKANHTYGMIFSYENLGLIYLATGRKKEVIPFMEKAITLLQSMENTNRHQSQIMEPLFRSYLATGMLDKAESILESYTSIIDNAEKNKDKTPRSFQINLLRCLAQSFYTRLYLKQGKTEKAEQAAKKANTLIKDDFDEDAKSNFHLAMGYFYYSTKDYSKAIENISNVSNSEYTQEALSLKSDIFNSMGKKDSALSIKKQLLEIKKQQNITAYTRQVSQLRALRELNEQELQDLRIEKQELKIKNKQRQLIILVVFSFTLLSILLILISYSIRTRKLGTALEKEKESLSQINENLKKAKEQAEKAEKMKGDFITDISQEIHIPLRSIIHSVKLLSYVSDDKRSELIQTINNNSDILLKLVNNVLHPSHPGECNLTINQPDAEK